MALYDNQHWLLSHVKNSFISSDDTGICEMVMLGEDIPRNLTSKLGCYPGTDQSEDEDEMDTLAHSSDILADMDLGAVRPRTNTSQRSEKHDLEREKRGKATCIKWENISHSTGHEPSLFQRKDFRHKVKEETDKLMQSLLVKQLQNYPAVSKNPFLEYAKFDGSLPENTVRKSFKEDLHCYILSIAQVGVPTRRYGIFMMMLPPAERNYPIYVVVVTTARVKDLIGLVCWKCTLEHGENVLGDSVEQYGLYIAEDDGEVDWDFPCLDPWESVSKFGFGYLALVERTDKNKAEEHSHKDRGEKHVSSAPPPKASKVPLKDVEDMQRMKGHMTAMEAPLYQSYRVYIINKVRTRTEIQLGISGEKIEIDPVIQQKVGAKFWNRQKAVSHDIDNIAACELTDAKAGGKTATLRLTYYSSGNVSSDPDSSSHSYCSVANYKHYDFETDQATAEEIVQKINNILDLTSPVRRQEYLDLKESKSHKKRIFHLGPK